MSEESGGCASLENLLAAVEDESAAACFGAEEAADEVKDGRAGVAREIGE